MKRNPNTTCFQCSAPVYIRPFQMEKQKSWFCSRECFFKANPGKEYVCQQCNIIFKVKGGATKPPKFCSRSCSNVGRVGIKYKGLPSNNNNKLIFRRAFLVERDGPNCKECGQEPVWNGKPLTLQVDHIDGNNSNNSTSNWRLLCPNCHTQTDTYAGKNIKKSSKMEEVRLVEDSA